MVSKNAQLVFCYRRHASADEALLGHLQFRPGVGRGAQQRVPVGAQPDAHGARGRGRRRLVAARSGACAVQRRRTHLLRRAHHRSGPSPPPSAAARPGRRLLRRRPAGRHAPASATARAGRRGPAGTPSAASTHSHHRVMTYILPVYDVIYSIDTHRRTAAASSSKKRSSTSSNSGGTTSAMAASKHASPVPGEKAKSLRLRSRTSSTDGTL